MKLQNAVYNAAKAMKSNDFLAFLFTIVNIRNSLLDKYPTVKQIKHYSKFSLNLAFWWSVLPPLTIKYTGGNINLGSIYKRVVPNAVICLDAEIKYLKPADRLPAGGFALGLRLLQLITYCILNCRALSVRLFAYFMFPGY